MGGEDQERLDRQGLQIGALEQEVEDLGIALDRRTTIGVALGILMERMDLDQDAAFAYLKRRSQDTNRKLYDLAVELAVTRRSG